MSETERVALYMVGMWAVGAISGFMVARGPTEWRGAIESWKRVLKAWREGRER